MAVSIEMQFSLHEMRNKPSASQTVPQASKVPGVPSVATDDWADGPAAFTVRTR